MKKTFLLIIALMQILTTSADFLTEQQARETAAAFLASHSGVNHAKGIVSLPTISAESLVMVSQEAINSAKAKATASQTKAKATGSQAKAVVSTTTVTSSQPYYYIFNKPDSTGFVIVSAESTTVQILAYSNEGYFHVQDIDKGAEVFLNQYEQDVQTARTQGLTAEQQAYVNALNSTESQDGDVKLETAALSQEDGDWKTSDYCPLINGTLYAPAGCVTTAMAIIMKYYGSPTRGKGNNSYTSTTNKLSLSRDFTKDTYDWSKIPTTAYSAGNWSDDAKKEAAKILLATGIACKTDYAYGSSGATTPNMLNALTRNFSYAVDYKRHISRNGESLTDAWTEARAELAAKRPVIVSADGLVDGLMQAHCFVMDGYNTSDNSRYHYNMGWGGANNGWYTDGAISNDNLKIYEIITGIQPATGTRVLESGTNSANQTYTVTDDGVLTISGTGKVPEMAPYITSTVLECKVENSTSIGNEAFKDIKFYKITLPSNLVFWGTNVFGINENLDSIKITTVTGGNVSAPNNKCLYNTSTKTLMAYCQDVSEITFPEDVTTIGAYACAFNKATKVEIPSTVTTIMNFAFFNNASLTELIIPETVTSIEKNAFAYCAINKCTCHAMYIPTMGTNVFDKSSSITVPTYQNLYVPYASVDMYRSDTQWGQFANVSAIEGTEGQENKYLVTADLSTTGAGSLSTALESKDMTSCRELVVKGELNGLDIAKLRELTPSTATLPLIVNLKDAKIITDNNNSYYDTEGKNTDGTTRTVHHYTKENEMSNQMFTGCKMKGFILPSTVTKLCYRFCPTGLVSIGMPEDLETIENMAFYSTQLISLNIPAKVTSIADGFLQSGNQLQNLTVAEGNTHYKSVDNVIYNTDGDYILASYSVTDSALIIPEGIKTIGAYAYNGSTFKAVTLPKSIETINNFNLNNMYLKTICCKATTPPTLGSYTLNTNSTYKGALKVYVPAASKEAYQAATNWSSLTGQFYDQGDLDANGRFTVTDLTRVVKILNTADYPYSFPADMNNDNSVTVEDSDQLVKQISTFGAK